MRRLDILWALLVGLALWQGLVWATGVQHFILPGPARVAEAFWVNRISIFENAQVTIVEVLLGLAIGTALGALTAIQLALSPLMQRLFLPILVFTQAVPVFALAPILTLWFGYGMASKIVMAVLIIYFPVTSAFFDGLRSAHPGLVDLSRTMGATQMQVMRRIRIPAALPSLGTGLRLAAVYAPIGAVIGEWVGASKGLGYLMLLANGRAKVDLMFAALITLAIFTVILHKLVGVLADRLSHYAEGRR
ncbi:putative hydroxymethylpyrimidine transport system permease protein [Litoreibacter ponti]|uniref:Putative hydroxymethylpyrimidine transport system permease protein n=1 Tax=Litoreibacter ponti TaxID=1510457 RepID=A0A2T6BJB4_9RHOB|nr:ABC transporter permease [Litoreibacter ponti]PTX56132.1 putative hydroxymethylpyrimidine transport system permease protein [Litoreibacter ponti]